MKLFLVIFLAVLAVGQTQKLLHKGIARQVYKTAVNKVITGNTHDNKRTKDAGQCAQCLFRTLDYCGVKRCRTTCKNTIWRANKDDLYNKYNNKKTTEDWKTARCVKCLVTNHLNKDLDVKTCNTYNNYACVKHCRVCDLDKILTYIFKVTTGNVGGVCRPTGNNQCLNYGDFRNTDLLGYGDGGFDGTGGDDTGLGYRDVNYGGRGGLY